MRNSRSKQHVPGEEEEDEDEDEDEERRAVFLISFQGRQSGEWPKRGNPADPPAFLLARLDDKHQDNVNDYDESAQTDVYLQRIEC